ncbi:DUF5707 domain-containing protein [Streptomyces sp. NPDC048172]|uniref:DUF5707 domain-containing protein n=1 Tax=Streptomyces sp. NPDC048172 TaxID=3365505 RepID=UPI0037219357
MNKRIVVPSVVGAVLVVGVGGIAVGTVASATGPTEPTVEDAKARYSAPTSGAGGSLTFTAKVSDDSGVRDLKVLAWPKGSDLKPKAGEMADVESAACEESSDETSTCTYTLKVSDKEAAELEKGTWHVSVLAKAEDGGTLFVPEAASFDVAGPVSSR